MNPLLMLTKDGTSPIGGSDNKNDENNYWPTSNTKYTRGGAADLWNAGLTPADVNHANFGVLLSAENFPNTNLDTTAFVDYIKVKVDYTKLCPDPDVWAWSSLMDTRLWTLPRVTSGDNSFNWTIVSGNIWEVLPAEIPPATSNRNRNTIATCCKFSDFNLRLKFRCPNMRLGTGTIWNLAWDDCDEPLYGARNWGNSGVKIFNFSGYEIQILDSYKGLDPSPDTAVPAMGDIDLQFDTTASGDPTKKCSLPTKEMCGALYNHKAPDSNTIKKATSTGAVAVPDGEWNDLEIGFMAPRFAWNSSTMKWDGKKCATVTVKLNGTTVQHRIGFPKGSSTADWDEWQYLVDDNLYGMGYKKSTGPILLQEHDNKVQFKDITINPKWIPTVGGGESDPFDVSWQRKRDGNNCIDP